LQGGGALGPNLRNGDTLRQFPNRQDHIDFIMSGTVYGKPYGSRGVGGIESGGMPGFGKRLTAKQIAAIVDYERSL
jgi:mono/diheme cytochrome c family protein